MSQHHDTRVAGLAGWWKTLELVARNYWWPQMSCYIGVRVPIFPIIVCVRSAYVIGAGVGFRVESGAVALLQLDL